MAVSTTYTPTTYNGNSSTTVFAVAWPFFTGTLLVTAISSTGVETVKALGTHYTVTGGTDVNGLPATGSVTMLTAPASGTTLRIERITPKVQSTVWVENDPFPAKSAEAMGDRLMLIAQENSGSGGGSGVTGDALRLDTSGATDYYNASTYPIRSTATPTVDSDLVTKVYGDANYGGTAATNAAASAAAALVSENNAETAETNAETAETNAEAAQVAAAASAASAAADAATVAASLPRWRESSSTPAGPHRVLDHWFDTDDGNIAIYGGSAYVEIAQRTHTHIATQINDSTAIGRAVLTAVDDTAARTALVLGNVNNTSDENKPVSSAQQSALNLKANLASPTFTGTPAAPTAAAATNTTQIATTAFVMAAVAGNAIVDIQAEYSLDKTGATNVATAFQAAITAIDALGKGFYLVAGTYDIGSATLSIPSGITVIAHPKAIIRRSAEPGTPARMITVGSNVHWTGGTLKHSTGGAAVASFESAAMVVDQASDTYIDRCVVEGRFYIGIAFDRCSSCAAIRNNIYGVRNRAFYAYQTCDDIHFDGNYISGYDFGTSTKYLDYGININPANTGGSNSCNDIRITNNTIEFPSGDGITVGDNSIGVVVSGNTIHGAGAHGIIIWKANGNTPVGVTVANNTVRNCTGNAMMAIDTFYTNFSGNTGQNCTGSGLVIAGSAYNTVSGNIFNNNGAHGIHVLSNTGVSSRTTIVGNHCIVCTGTGLLIAASQYGTYYNMNVIYANTAAQITDSGTASATTGNLTA